MVSVSAIAIVVLSLVTSLFGLLAWRFRSDAQRLRQRFSGILDLDEELTQSRKTCAEIRAEQCRLEADAMAKRQELGRDYENALVTYNALKTEVSALEENLEDMSFGLYKPHFDFETTEQYKAALQKLRDQEKDVIRSGGATFCPITWTVGNSRAEGTRMVKLHSKLLLRAFNGECEAARSDVSWNNIATMEARLRKSFEAINKTGDVEKISITEEYFRLKLSELRLTYELQQRRYEDREEQRRIREQIREEERAEREFEKAREDAETEEKRFQLALERAREEAARTTGAQLERLTEKIASFEAKLDEARRKKERAIARAQITKSGFVYVISNIGSFGEKVFKIGMTRRLEPMERVQELGDASVPFPFDLHAMLYSDNAPELERALQRHFEERRLNLVNPRREFYRDVDLEEVERFVRDRGLSAQFVRVPEAREYRESIVRRDQISTPKTADQPTPVFASQLFEGTIVPQVLQKGAPSGMDGTGHTSALA